MDSTIPGTWHSRNPQGLVQPVHPTQYKLPPTAAQKASQALASQNAEERSGKLNDAIAECVSSYEAELGRIAEEHHISAARAGQLALYGGGGRKHRAVTLHNAILHIKSLEVDQGDKDMQGLQSLANGPIKEISAEDATTMKLVVLQFRNAKIRGMRLSSKACAADVSRTMKHLDAEINNLYRRTGIGGIAFIGRSHVDDTAQATIIGSPGALGFFKEVLKKSYFDIARMFESWMTANEDTSMHGREDLTSLRTECSGLIREGLERTARKKKITMNYVNYETAIVATHGVKLIGWNFGGSAVPISPSDINTVSEVRRLRDALQDGTCHWVSLSKDEKNVLGGELSSRKAAGEVIGKKRKERSDKGTKRKAKAKPVGAPAPAKRARPSKAATQVPPSQRCKSILSSDSDEEE